MNLSNRNIAQALEDVQEFFSRTGVSDKDKVKIQLVVEESLLRWQEHFGEQKDFQLQKHKWFGAPSITIKISGDGFNPLKTSTNELAIFSEEVMKSLLAYDRAQVNYIYQNT